MSSIGDPVTQPVPAVGTAGTGYASQLVALLTEIKNRVAAKVPISSIVVALLDMANNAIANLAYASFYEATSSPASPVGSIQRYQGDLWYVSPSGAFRMTSGASLNATALGGFTGDYGGANPASAKFVDADKEYYFYDDLGAANWAYVWGRGFDIAQGLTGANRVRLQWTGSTSYDITLPPAAPGAGTFLQMAATGAITASNVLAAGSVTAPEFKHSTALGLQIPASQFQDAHASHVKTDGATSGAMKCFSLAGSANKLTVPISLPVGSRITSYTLYCNKLTNNTNTLAARLFRCAAATGTIGVETALGAGNSSSANAPGAIVLTETGLSIDIIAAAEFYLQIAPGGGVTPANDQVYLLEVGYTRP